METNESENGPDESDAEATAFESMDEPFPEYDGKSIDEVKEYLQENGYSSADLSYIIEYEESKPGDDTRVTLIDDIETMIKRADEAAQSADSEQEIPSAAEQRGVVDSGQQTPTDGVAEPGGPAPDGPEQSRARSQADDGVVDAQPVDPTDQPGVIEEEQSSGPRRTDDGYYIVDGDRRDPATESIYGANEVPKVGDIPNVKVTSAVPGYHRGVNFQNEYDTAIVARTRRIDNAIVQGDLVYVEDVDE